MPASELTIRLVAGALLTLSNAFFVVTEFALTRIPQFDEDEFQDSPGLRRAWEMTGRLEIYLTGCQLGITTSSILLGIVAEPAMTALVAPVFELLNASDGTVSALSVVLAIVIINLSHKIWGEQAPTYLGVEKPKAIARVTAPMLYWWTKITYPFILLGDGLAKQTLNLFGVQIHRSWTDVEVEDQGEQGVGSRTELKRKMAELLREQNVPHDRQEEVLSALNIGDIPIRDIMVPRDKVVALSTGNSPEENAQIAMDHALSRFPLVGNTLDEVRGIIYVPILLRNWDKVRAGETSLDELAVPPVVVPASCSVSDFIDHLQEKDQELALVTEEGRIAGLMTITDAFEAIAGEVQDPLDRVTQQMRRRKTHRPKQKDQ